MTPTMDIVKGVEKDTLKIISEIAEFANYEGLYQLANNWRNQFTSNNIDIYFGLAMDIRLRADAHKTVLKRSIYMGMLASSANTHPELSNSTYSLVICEDDKEKSKIIRKIHFDYEHANLIQQSSEKKPSFHIQICGKLSPHLKKIGYEDADIEAFSPGFEKPRIPSMPICLAILINWVLLEFDCDKTAKRILMNDQWRKHVADAERKILKPYFKNGLEFLEAAAHKDRSFFSEKLYIQSK